MNVPYPDYHVLWLGGTLAKHACKGDKCYVVSISGGERGVPTEIPIDAKRWIEEFGRSKTSGARERAKVLGIVDFKVLDFEDTKIHNTSELQTSIIKLILEYEQEIVLAHWLLIRILTFGALLKLLLTLVSLRS